MSAAEFRRWQQFYAQEPVDETATHVLIAKLVTLLHNVNRGNGQPIKVSYYAPFLDRVSPDDGEEGLSMDALMSDGW